MIARLLIGAALTSPFWVSTGVLALAYRRGNLRWRAAARDATAANLRADAWRDYARTQDQELRGAHICLELALTRWYALTDQRAELVRDRNRLRAQNAELTDAFRAIFPAANGDLRTHVERAIFIGVLPSELFPTQRTGDTSDQD